MVFAYSFIVLPLLIFLARIVDVSLGTIRIIFISKGFKFLSPFIGFFEVLIWLIALNQIWHDMTNIFLYIAYAGGFAAGNYVGIWLEEKISIGISTVRIIIRKNQTQLIEELKKNNYPLTIIDAESGKEKEGVKMIFLMVKRKELKNIFKIMKRVNPKAFFTVEDVRSIRKNEYLVTGKKGLFRRLSK